MFIDTIFGRKRLILAGLLLLVNLSGPRLACGKDQDTLRLPDIHYRRPIGIHQVFDYGFDLPVDSCRGYAFLYKVIFDPLPELNKPSHVRVKAKACYSSDRVIRSFVHGNFSSMDCSQTGMKIFTSGISKSEIYEWDIVIVPRDIGAYRLEIGWGEYFFAFNESGKLVYLDTMEDPDFKCLPNHPALNDKEIVIWGGNQNFTNVFRIVPPPFLNDTSIVYYKLTAKRDYPIGVKVSASPKRWQGPIKAGDVYEGSFPIVPDTVGHLGLVMFINEYMSPRGRMVENLARFPIHYILDEKGKLKFIAGYELKDETLLDKYK
jgi:hypothetical protein